MGQTAIYTMYYHTTPQRPAMYSLYIALYSLSTPAWVSVFTGICSHQYVPLSQ